MAETGKPSVDNGYIPVKDRMRIRNKQIVGLYRSGLSMDEVVKAMSRLGYGVSKTTVFFAINGRSKKSAKKSRGQSLPKNQN